ncbi:MAG: hypothetical protein IJP24_04985 [Firmicutes bacterium]|nr:hypothetical protein [Bacillota bacterium]
MKKALAILLALTLVLASAVTVFAAEFTGLATPQHDTHDVIVTYSNTTGNVYKVDVEWETLTFEYQKSLGTWSTTNHDYTGGSAGWVDDEKSITITNHSNATIYYQALLDNGTATKTMNAATVTLSNNTGSLATDADDTGTATCPTTTIQADITGSANSNFTLGTVTLTISASSI